MSSAARSAWLERSSWLRRNRRLLTEAMRLALRAEIDLRVLPFTHVLARLNAWPRPGERPPECLQIAGVYRAVRWAYRLLPLSSTCLKTSLVFCDMLTRRGVRAELRIGVMKTSDGVASHAWVEDDLGATLTDPLAGFFPLPLSRPHSPIVSPDGL